LKKIIYTYWTCSTSNDLIKRKPIGDPWNSEWMARVRVNRRKVLLFGRSGVLRGSTRDKGRTLIQNGAEAHGEFSLIWENERANKCIGLGQGGAQIID